MNTNKLLKIFLLIVGLTVVAITSGKIFSIDISNNQDSTSNQIVILNDNTSFFPDLFEDFSYYKHDTISDTYYLYDSKDNLNCYLLLTMPYCEDIKGFGGSIPFAIVFNPDDKIRELYLLNHSETPSWIENLEDIGFFKTFVGMTAKEILSTEINAITGATLSSNAIIESCNKRLSIYSKATSSNKKKSWVNILGIIVGFLFLIFAILSFINPKALKRYRFFLIISSIGIIGFWQGDFLSLALFNNWLINGVNIGAQILLFTILILSILIPTITNKDFYCQYVCPFGASQELVGMITKKKANISQPVSKILKKLKFVFLFILFILLVSSLDFKLEDVEPFTSFRFKFASVSTMILALVILFLSIFFYKPWCRFLCPTGAFLSLFRGKLLKAKKGKIKIGLFLNIILGVLVLVLIYINVVAYYSNNKPKQVKSKKETIIMNSTLDVIHKRKSVRHFTDDEVSKEQLKKIVKAGMAAPTARNLQPWAFVVITERNTLDKLAAVLPYSKMLEQAQAAIVVCGDMKKVAKDNDSVYWVQDCAAASENILLAVESMELGAVWTSIFPYPEKMNPVIEILEMPENIIPLNIIPIGVPTGEDKPKNKWKPKNLHWEKY